MRKPELTWSSDTLDPRWEENHHQYNLLLEVKSSGGGLRCLEIKARTQNHFSGAMALQSTEYLLIPCLLLTQLKLFLTLNSTNCRQHT